MYNPKEKVLLSSDTLWQNDLPVITIRIEGSRALFSLQESLEQIESLDVDRVYPGHGMSMERILKRIFRISPIA